MTLLNIHKPRDRTHYEQFRAFHMSFYRAVEATSVTPFAPRALDRALAATLVAALRHVDPDLTPNKAADRIAGNAAPTSASRTRSRRRCDPPGRTALPFNDVWRASTNLKNAWIEIADKQTKNGGDFAYANEEPVRRLLQVPFEQQTEYGPEREWFLAARSMRDTEPVALLKIRGPDGGSFP